MTTILEQLVKTSFRDVKPELHDELRLAARVPNFRLMPEATEELSRIRAMLVEESVVRMKSELIQSGIEDSPESPGMYQHEFDAFKARHAKQHYRLPFPQFTLELGASGFLGQAERAPVLVLFDEASDNYHHYYRKGGTLHRGHGDSTWYRAWGAALTALFDSGQTVRDRQPRPLNSRVARTLVHAERHLIRFDATLPRSLGGQGSGVGSPKCHHSVRGHWRQYASGRRVWIEAHERGDEALGSTASSRYFLRHGA